VDKKFLEFWGRMLLAAAQGQKQSEDLNRWMSGSAAGPDEWTALFRRIYALGDVSVGAPAWETAAAQFRSSVKQWLALMDFVPKSEYAALKKRHDALLKTTAAQQETIRELKSVLAAKGAAPPDALKDFTEQMNQQARQFQELMASFGEAFKSGKS